MYLASERHGLVLLGLCVEIRPVCRYVDPSTPRNRYQSGSPMSAGMPDPCLRRYFLYLVDTSQSVCFEVPCED